MRTDDNKPLKEYVPLANDLENYWIYKNYTGDPSQRIDENLVQVGRGKTDANRYYVIVTEDHSSYVAPSYQHWRLRNRNGIQASSPNLV